MVNETPQSTALRVLLKAFAAGTVTAATGKTIAVVISKNGGAFANPSAGATNATEIANGWYYVDLSTTDTNTLGDLVVRGTEGTIDAAERIYRVVKATNRGMTALPDAAAEEAGGLFTRGTGAGQINQDANGRIDTRWVNGNVTVGTNNDKTGYSLTQAFPTNFASLGINASGHVTRVVLADTVTTLTNAPSDSSGVTTLLSRLSASRAGYLDFLNVGGNVATQADVQAINQSASRRIIITTVGQYERPESGSSNYTIEARTYDEDGAAVDADSTPTLTATGIVSGSLAANLSSATNPATGVYRWTYTVSSAATLEQVRFDVSATLSASTFTLACYTQVTDFVSSTWTAADRTKLEAVYDKLPAGDISDFDPTTDSVDVGSVSGSADAATNIETVFDTDFNNNYDATFDGWKVVLNSDQIWTGLYSVNSTGQILKDLDASVGSSGVTVSSLTAGAISSVQSGLATQASVDTVDGVADAILAFVEADQVIVTTTTPWTLEYRQRGTSTVLLTKNLKTLADGNVTAATDTVGRKVQP